MNKTLLIPHGVIFFFDESHPDLIPPLHENGAIVDANDSSLSVLTLVDVDGEVFVELSNEIAESKKEEMLHVFEGVINAPKRKVGMSTSDADTLMQVEVSNTKARLSVWIDDPKFPGVVLVEAK